MRAYLFVLLASLIHLGIVSSHQHYSEAETIRLAKESYWRDPQNQLQGRFESFEDLNWRMPRDLREVEKHIKWTAKQSGIKGWNHVWIAGKQKLKRYTQLLRSDDSYFVFFHDSCFFYNRRWEVGCVLYDSHCLLLNIDPWNYASRADFLDSKGLNMGEWEKGESFFADMEAISREYPHQIMCSRDYEGLNDQLVSFSPLLIGEDPIHDKTRYREIVSFYRDGTFQFHCNKNMPDSLWVEYTKNEVELFPAPDDPESICQDYVKSLGVLAQTYLKETEKCQTIICAVPLVY